MFHISGFQETGVHNTWSDSSKERTTMYLRDSTEVLRETIFFLDKVEDFIFWPVSKRLHVEVTTFQSSHMQTAHFHNISRLDVKIVLSCKVE